MASRDRFVPESDPVMAHNTSNTNSLSTVTEMNRASAALSSSASATIDDANVTYFVAPVRDSNPDEEPDHIGSNQSEETEQVGERLQGIRKDTISEPCMRKDASADDKIKALTEPTVCTEDCKLKKSPRTIFDYEAAIRHHLLRLQTHLEAKNTTIWTRKELDVVGKRQKKKPYQVEEPKVTEGEETEAAKKKKIYWEGKESMDKMDVLLEKLYDDLPELLDKLQKWISKESYLYHLLSTRDQFWPSKKFLSDDPIIDELKNVIADKVGTLNRDDKKEKKKKANSQGSILFRCKDKMFKNCFEVFHFHGKELTDLINTLLDLKLGEVEPPQAKRKRLFEEEEIQNEVMRNIKICSRPVQSTPMLVEVILKELGMQLSSNLVPLTYEQLEQALGQDIRPILREFLMDPTQTVENTVRGLVQLSNNQFIQSRTLDTTVLLVALREPIVWRTIIFDWLAERRMDFSAAMPVATMEGPQDEDLQITSVYDDGSICKTTSTTTLNDIRQVPGEKNDDDSLEGKHTYSPTGVQKEQSVDLSSKNSTIPPLTSCFNGPTSPLTTEEYYALMNWDPVLQPLSSTGDATVGPSLYNYHELNCQQQIMESMESGGFDESINQNLPFTHPEVYNREPENYY